MITHSDQQSPTTVTNAAGELEMACLVANVRHIIVCGHSDCKVWTACFIYSYCNQSLQKLFATKDWKVAEMSTSLIGIFTAGQRNFQSVCWRGGGRRCGLYRAAPPVQANPTLWLVQTCLLCSLYCRQAGDWHSTEMPSRVTWLP